MIHISFLFTHEIGIPSNRAVLYLKESMNNNHAEPQILELAELEEPKEILLPPSAPLLPDWTFASAPSHCLLICALLNSPSSNWVQHILTWLNSHEDQICPPLLFVFTLKVCSSYSRDFILHFHMVLKSPWSRHRPGTVLYLHILGEQTGSFTGWPFLRSLNKLKEWLSPSQVHLLVKGLYNNVRLWNDPWWQNYFSMTATRYTWL